MNGLKKSNPFGLGDIVLFLYVIVVINTLKSHDYVQEIMLIQHPLFTI